MYAELESEEKKSTFLEPEVGRAIFELVKLATKNYALCCVKSAVAAAALLAAAGTLAFWRPGEWPRGRPRACAAPDPREPPLPSGRPPLGIRTQQRRRW